MISLPEIGRPGRLHEASDNARVSLEHNLDKSRLTMGSAFMPVIPRRTPSSSLNKPSSSLNRQLSSPLPATKKMKLSDIDEVPESISVSGSENSSKGGQTTVSGEPRMRTLCVGELSEWFTNCFPCAITDINDNDHRAVDKFSRESAMNDMYSNENYTFDGYPLQEKQQQQQQQQHSVSDVVIEEESVEEEAVMDSVPLGAEKIDSVHLIVEKSPTSPPRIKQKFGGMKLFMRKKSSN